MVRTGLPVLVEAARKQQAPRKRKSAGTKNKTTGGQSSRGFGAANIPEGSVEQQRAAQEQATSVLAELMKAPDEQARVEIANANVELLDESFFHMCSTYMVLAEKEGNDDVYKLVELCTGVAMAAKNKTLRPEIQLLNNLLQEPSSDGRKLMLRTLDGRSALQSDNGYFFALCDRLILDNDRAKNLKVATQVREIKKEAELVNKEP